MTVGGVSLAEIDPQTMESKKCHGLYLAGEVADLDGPTGGYNLQAAFSTARLAVSSVGKRCGKGSFKSLEKPSAQHAPGRNPRGASARKQRR